MPTDADPMPRPQEPERPDIRVVAGRDPTGAWYAYARHGDFAVEPGEDDFRLPGTRTLREREERRKAMILGLQDLIAAPPVPDSWRHLFENVIKELRGEA